MTKPQVRVECSQALCQIISNVRINESELLETVYQDSFQKPTIAIRINLLQVFPSMPFFVLLCYL